MASPILSEPNSASWWNYFFLYDGSKVKEEGDPTRAGICYFYPSQTLLDQQELLCGQIAGVVRCITEISSAPPSLIRLRKLKFAVRVDGEYLWVLGCTIELPDVSCGQFLDLLIGLFRFYNGPVCHAYMVFSREELSTQWDRYIEHIQKNTSDLHKIFNSLWNLDKTKVDPLLLLKAALILQTCQRSPQVLAGCILYKGQIVSTQLPPPLTAKVLLQGTEAAEKSVPGGGEVLQEHDPALPQDVCILPVSLTDDEATALRDFPVEWMTRLPTSPANPKGSKITLHSRAFLDSARVDEVRGQHGLVVREPPPQAWGAAKAKDALNPPDGALSSPGSKSPVLSSAPLKPSPLLQRELGALPSSSKLPAAESTQDTSAALGSSDFPKPCALGQEGRSTTEPVTSSNTRERMKSECCSLQRRHSASGSHSTCYPSKEMRRSRSSERDNLSSVDSQDTSSQNRTFKRGDGATRDDASGQEPLPSAVQLGQKFPAEDCGRNQFPVAEVRESLCSGIAEGPGSPKSRENGLPSQVTTGVDCLAAVDCTVSGNQAKLVKMILYIHRIKGLVLLLLAEEQFKDDQGSIEDVYHSSLASLNGLEVHLKETLPKDHSSAAKATYSFTHYDCIQNVLTANLPQVLGAQDQHFLRAASLIHSDFNQLPTASEMTIRNASTAVYACQNLVQETYFQQLAAPLRNSGVPNPHDSAFSLPGKAKQKLLKHGVNLL
ncbi:Hermansky-Pudlak syndrome 4 protein isoform X1 [Chelonia mydas]|uniref:Hermansky-Pudlak syndrome 4 protein isoform X1 n=2 Tax=Chelonia mydas TaxID=8469 RepID=UPI0018A23BE2|nr:Hermansky-Pudlak syndrome 4 protein isoform X1 [Chelonia mydas]XP_037734626.1 Hermansky-Pudlak syndrome 4 protein isoform X1 [Chelonia mydas]XP_037734629.1 Hermansky-Pudlak syndrome 4 protein isoform X1 [Chelonia mydas]